MYVPAIVSKIHSSEQSSHGNFEILGSLFLPLQNQKKDFNRPFEM